MPWAAGTYTKGNNSTGGWTGDASLGIGIEAGRHDTQDNDFATGINQCLNKDGSNAATGNLNVGGFKITNVAAGTSANDVTTLTQIQSGVDQQTTTTAYNITKFSADGDGRYLYFRKSRGATIGTNTIVNNGDAVGAIFFQGANGTGYNNAAAIVAEIDGTPGASNDMPGRLRFLTTADGSGSQTERMRIDSGGLVGIGLTPSAGTRLRLAGLGNTDGTNSLLCTQSGGSPTFLVTDFGLLQAPYVWNKTNAAAANMYIDSAGTFWRSTSSLRYKENVADLPYGLAKALELRAVVFNSKNETNGKVYGGLIAEEVHEAGLHEFVVYTDKNEPDAIHYGNMVALAFKAIQELNAKVEALEARVAELEK